MPKLSTKLTAVLATAAAGAGGLIAANLAGAADTSPGTSSECRPADGRDGPDGPGGRDGARGELTAVAKALGVTEAKLRSAVEAGTPDRSASEKADPRAASAAAIAKSLEEETADVQAVLGSLGAGRERGDHGPHGDGGPRREDTALVAALVKRFSVTTAKAQAAVDAARTADDAEHTARETALYAAIAKALGKDAAVVQKAFEANRPTRPNRTS